MREQFALSTEEHAPEITAYRAGWHTPAQGTREIYANGPDTIIAGTAVPGGGRGVPVEGGYRVTGRWRFGSGCQTLRLASFASRSSCCRILVASSLRRTEMPIS